MDRQIEEPTAESAVEDTPFSCSACGTSTPRTHLGREIEGRPYCIECSLELTRKGVVDEVQTDNAAQKERIDTQEEKQAKRDKARRLKQSLLAASLTLILVEGALLVLTRPPEPTGDPQVKVELSSTFMVHNALERYRDDVGSYPVILDQLIPKYWNSTDQGELHKYAYIRTSGDRFLLERVTPGLTGPGNTAGGPPTVRYAVDDQTRFSDLFAGMGGVAP